MVAVVQFYEGAVSRSDYWAMPGDERRALREHMWRVLEARRASVGR